MGLRLASSHCLPSCTKALVVIAAVPGDDWVLCSLFMLMMLVLVVCVVSLFVVVFLLVRVSGKYLGSRLKARFCGRYVLGGLLNRLLLFVLLGWVALVTSLFRAAA